MRSPLPSFATSAFWMMALYSLILIAVPSQASSIDLLAAPSQYVHYARSLNEDTPLNTIHVVPPSPDDTPKECEPTKNFHDSCGPQRYCAPLSGGNASNSWLEDDTHNKTTTSYYCLHKTLWFPALDARDLVAFLLAGTCCFLAAMGGIGGGGLVLPILLLCCNFTPKEASVLSNTAVFCNTLGQFCVNNWIKRPRSERNNNKSSQIIYATVLMIMPGLIAGGSLAITLEGMVPSTVILILALFTLLLASTKTYQKAQKLRAAERESATPPPPPPPTSTTNLESLSSLAASPSSSTSRNPDLEEVKEDEALIASGLEWTADTPSATPASKQSNPLSDASDVLEENFLGSIRYLNREEVEENCVNIIDESSMTASYDFGAQSETTSISTALAGNERRRGVNLEINHNDEEEEASRDSFRHRHAGCCRGIAYCMHQNKLQLLIFSCWALDATTFLVLHSGTLVRKCSPAFFVLVCLPAVVAAGFVWMGRRHLLAQRTRRQDHSGVEEDERQPLMTSFLLPISPIARVDHNDDEEEAYEPVPNLATGTEQAPQTPPLSMERNWVLLVPLLSALAGIVKALGNRRGTDRTVNRQASLGTSDPQYVPLLDPPPTEIGRPLQSNRTLITTEIADDLTTDEETRLQEKLLTCWLPWAAFLIGLLAALLGIGGGELLGPILLLLLKMDPQQSSATTAIMSMMNSGTNMLHYMVADMMTAPGYAINLGIAGLVGGSGGRLQAVSMAETGRTSVIALSLFVVLSLATGLVAWELSTTPISWASNGGVC